MHRMFPETVPAVAEEYEKNIKKVLLTNKLICNVFFAIYDLVRILTLSIATVRDEVCALCK